MKTNLSSSDSAPKSPNDIIGGATTVGRLCARLYELMDELLQAKACRDVHPPSLAHADEKLFEFMSGWLGGHMRNSDNSGEQSPPCRGS